MFYKVNIYHIDYGIFTMQRKGYKRVNMCDIYQKNSFSDFFLRVNYLLVSMSHHFFGKLFFTFGQNTFK